MPQDLHIGEVANRTGRSVHAIRWYEAQGLLPGVARDAGGRRVYSDYHIGWLDLMERLRLTGMSIAQMRAYTSLAKQGSATLVERRALLAAHQLRVDDTISRWSEALALIDAKATTNGWRTASGRPFRRIAGSADQRAPRRRWPDAERR